MSRSWLHQRLQTMIASIAHRGPDGNGCKLDPQSGLALGHSRLSILDLSAAGTQPMASRDERWHLTFNGEIYNFRELAREVGPLRSTCDAEVLLELVALRGVEATLPRLNGMFAFAIWDSQLRELWLVRDRLGIKPLYYAHCDQTLLFGSELGALSWWPGLDDRLDPHSLDHFLATGSVPGSRSILGSVSRLGPGSWLRLRSPGGVPQIESWWSAHEVALGARAVGYSGSFEDAEQELELTLSQAVKDRLVADVPVGAFLSGGIDSSAVVAFMQAHSTTAAHTFAVGFREPSFDESPHAALVAQRLGTRHTCAVVDPADLPTMLEGLFALGQEPLGDASRIPTFLVSRLARNDVAVALSGDGGDELFGGYSRYRWARRLWSVFGRVPLPWRRLLASAARSGLGALRFAPPTGPRIARLEKLLSLAPAASREDLYQRLISRWEDPSSLLAGTGAPSPRPTRLPPGLTTEESAMLLDATGYLVDDILTKVDQASMAVGLEVRIPLLDYRVFELAWRLPLRWKIRRGRGKILLRRVVGRHLPEALFARPKRGFGVPLGRWLRGPLRDWADEALSKRNLERTEIFEPQRIRDLWREHCAGQREIPHQLWSIIVLQRWRLGMLETAAALKPS